MKLLILKVSAGSFYFHLLAPIISLSILFSDTIVMCSFRIVRTQASHCCRRTDEVRNFVRSPAVQTNTPL